MTEQTVIELENKDEKNNKSAFLKVKERFSIRSKSKNKNSTDIPDTTENNKDSNGKNPETAAENGKETPNKEKIIEPEVSDDGKKEKKTKSSNTLERLKLRLSTKKKNSKKSEGETKDEEEIVVSTKVETEHSDDDKKEAEEKTKEEKSKNLLQRILRFFRSKKNRDNVDKGDKEAENSDPPDDKNDGNSDDDEDNEIIAICGRSDEEEKEAETTVVIPTITTNKPPLPVGRRLPSSATTTNTRPMSQLDAALKQFKLSTAASRENLRNSRQDLSQMEEQVKVQLRSRPATPVIGLRGQEPDTKFSSSLSDLRQWDELRAEIRTQNLCLLLALNLSCLLLWAAAMLCAICHIKFKYILWIFAKLLVT